MPRKHKQILPFRIPFFRIFYSTTYTIIFLVLLIFLAITPGSLLWAAISNNALQYVFIIGGVYILTALLAIFIYSSRLYTNRSVLAGVGKAYIPIEDGEVSSKVRKLVFSQLERSAIVSWEAKPRDIRGELAFAQKEGLVIRDAANVDTKVDTIGTIIPVDINDPPWGVIQHPGWTAPSDAPSELQNDLQFEIVIAEIPNLIEARAVSLAPLTASGEPDAQFVEILRRQEKMGMREYLTQLSYLQLIDLNSDGRDLLLRYEQARFSGQPVSYIDFKALMLAFGRVMDNMKLIDPAIADEIRAQVAAVPSVNTSSPLRHSNESDTASMEEVSPVTARTRRTTPYLSQGNASLDSVSSVLHSTMSAQHGHDRPLSSGQSMISEVGSVLHETIE